MRPQLSYAKPISLLGLFTIGLLLSQSSVTAQTEPKFVIKPVAEKKLARLPTGPLFWRVESFPTLAQAQTAEGPASLAAEISGKAWLFSLGGQGGSTPGGIKVAEIGPVPEIGAPEYLLRINNAGGPPGSSTTVHTHPGSETFYVPSGRLSQQTPQGMMHVEAGQSMAGRAPGMAMEISSSGKSDLNVLVMFVVDATKPFSSPAKFRWGKSGDGTCRSSNFGLSFGFFRYSDRRFRLGRRRDRSHQPKEQIDEIVHPMLIPSSTNHTETLLCAGCRGAPPFAVSPCWLRSPH